MDVEVVVLMGAGPRRGACCCFCEYSECRGALVFRLEAASFWVFESEFKLIDTLEAATI